MPPYKCVSAQALLSRVLIGVQFKAKERPQKANVICLPEAKVTIQIHDEAGTFFVLYWTLISVKGTLMMGWITDKRMALPQVLEMYYISRTWGSAILLLSTTQKSIDTLYFNMGLNVIHPHFLLKSRHMSEHKGPKQSQPLCGLLCVKGLPFKISNE